MWMQSLETAPLHSVCSSYSRSSIRPRCGLDMNQCLNADPEKQEGMAVPCIPPGPSSCPFHLANSTSHSRSLTRRLGWRVCKGDGRGWICSRPSKIPLVFVLASRHSREREWRRKKVSNWSVDASCSGLLRTRAEVLHWVCLSLNMMNGCLWWSIVRVRTWCYWLTLLRQRQKCCVY
jgi:hypothetical protein